MLALFARRVSVNHKETNISQAIRNLVLKKNTQKVFAGLFSASKKFQQMPRVEFHFDL